MLITNPKTPLQAVRAKCVLDCCSKKQEEVRECPAAECPLYRYRMRKGGGSVLSAIRKKCLDCSGGSFKDVAECVATDCVLYPYRFGKRPSTVAKKAAKGASNA